MIKNLKQMGRRNVCVLFPFFFLLDVPISLSVRELWKFFYL